jgi:hypothetical protein
MNMTDHVMRAHGEGLQAAVKTGEPGSGCDYRALADSTSESWGRSGDVRDPYPKAGFTYVGQLIAHELSYPDPADESTILPGLNLNTIYGVDPKPGNDIFDEEGHFRSEPNDPGDPFHINSSDVLRHRTGEHKGIAIIPDTRNDRVLILSQLHRTLQLCHDKLIDTVFHQETDVSKKFELARTSLTHGFQSLVFNDYLRAVCDGNQISQALSPPLENPRIGVDPDDEDTALKLMSHGALRYGHSTIRSHYALNDFTSAPDKKIAIDRLLALHERQTPGVRADWIIDWKHFFHKDGEKDNAQTGRPIDNKLTQKLLELPLASLPDENPETNLALRDLNAADAHGLKSGQHYAEKAGCTVYSGPKIGIDKAIIDKCGIDLNEETPLWYYLLREAMIEQKDEQGHCGLKLGTLGSRILVDVVKHVLLKDNESYVNNDEYGRDWSWYLEVPGFGPIKTFADLVRFAGPLDS